MPKTHIPISVKKITDGSETAGSNREYQKYYEECAKYYRDQGDHSSAATYAQYSLHYANLANEDPKTAETVVVEVDRSDTQGVAAKIAAKQSIIEVVKKPVPTPTALTMLNGYESDSD